MQPQSQPMLPGPRKPAGNEPTQLPDRPEIHGRTMPANLEEMLQVMQRNLITRFTYLPLIHQHPAENGMLASSALRELHMTCGPALFSRLTYELARSLDQENLVWCIPAFFAIRQECLAAKGNISSLCMLYTVIARENNLPPAIGADAIAAEAAARQLMAQAGRDPGEGPITQKMSDPDMPEYLGERMSDLFIWRNGGYRALVGDGRAISQRFLKIAEEHLIHVERGPDGRVTRAWPRDEVVGMIMDAIMAEEADPEEDEGAGDDDSDE